MRCAHEKTYATYAEEEKRFYEEESRRKEDLIAMSAARSAGAVIGATRDAATKELKAQAGKLREVHEMIREVGVGSRTVANDLLLRLRETQEELTKASRADEIAFARGKSLDCSLKIAKEEYEEIRRVTAEVGAFAKEAEIIRLRREDISKVVKASTFQLQEARRTLQKEMEARDEVTEGLRFVIREREGDLGRPSNGADMVLKRSQLRRLRVLRSLVVAVETMGEKEDRGLFDVISARHPNVREVKKALAEAAGACEDKKAMLQSVTAMENLQDSVIGGKLVDGIGEIQFGLYDALRRLDDITCEEVGISSQHASLFSKTLDSQNKHESETKAEFELSYGSKAFSELALLAEMDLGYRDVLVDFATSFSSVLKLVSQPSIHDQRLD